MAKVTLSKRDVDLIARVVDTEVPRSIAGRASGTYDTMVRAVVDTVMNRVASPDFPNTVEGVLDQDRAFSKITGPSRLDPYGSAAKAPEAPASVLGIVQNHVSARANGAPSTIGQATHYANPNFSDRKNLLGWINPMIEAGAQKLGIGNAIHVHGTPPGQDPAPEFDVAFEGDQGSPGGLLASLFNTPGAQAAPLPEAAPRDPLAFASIAEPGTSAPGLLGAPTGGVQTASLGFLPDALPPAPVGGVEQGGLLAGLPGSLPASPVRPVSTASLDPVTRFPPLDPVPVGSVQRSNLQDLPQSAGSAPVGAVERGLLANLPGALPASPVGAIESGGMLRPAQFGGDPILANSGQFASPDPTFAQFGQNPDIVPTGSGPMDFVINNNPTGEMGTMPLGSAYPATPAPFGNTEQPYTGDYALADSLRFSDFQNPMGAPYGTAQVPISPTGGEGLSVMPMPSEALPPLPDPITVATLPAEPAQPLPVAPTSQQVEESRRSLDVTDAEYAAQLRAAGLSETEIQLALSQRTAAPVQPVMPQMAPQQPVQQQTAPQASSTPQPAPTPPPPSGMDVWQGNSNYGVATDGSTLSRNPDGSVSRYSAQYDRWDTLNPQTGQWLPGGGPSSSINLPSRDRLVQQGKSMGASAAGGLLGSSLLGPVGGLLGAVVARNMIEGKGILGNQTNTTQPASQSTYDQLAAEARRSALQTNGGAFQSGSQNPSDYSYSPAAHDMANAGLGGLF